jgi:VWFA-related protein
VLAVVLAAAVTAIAAQEPEGALRIDAVAVTRDGKPVPALTAEDFEVWLNGRRLPIESIRAVSARADHDQGRLFVLLLDDVTIEPAMVLRVRDAAQRFARRLRPGDRMAVLRLSGGILELTADPVRLQSRIGAFNQTGGLLPLDRLGAHLLTTLAAVSRELGEAPERRKVIVAIGSGWLLDTPIPPPQIAPDVRREWTDAVRAMGMTDLAYYVVDPGGVGRTVTGGSGGFARDAGGHAFVNTNDVDGAVDQILADTDTYYEILVKDPPFGRGGALRELEVRSRRPGVTVRARRWIPGSRAGR